MLQLTRNMYAKDEVEASLMFAMIKKHPLEECLYWTNELITSGFNITYLLLSIYYDFYAQFNPGLHKLLLTCLMKLRKGADVECIYSLIKTLRLRKSSDNVLSLRLAVAEDKTKLSKGRVPSWLIDVPKEYRPLARAIEKQDWKVVVDVLDGLKRHGRLVHGDVIETVKAVITGLLHSQQIGFKAASPAYTMDDVYTEWVKYTNMINKLYGDVAIYKNEAESHCMLALLVSLLTEDNLVNYKRMLIRLTPKEHAFVKSLDALPSTDHSYKYLVGRRQFRLAPEIGVFALQRDNYSEAELWKEYAYRWVYHCSNTPYWKKVFDANGIWYDSKGELVFADDDDDSKLDAFGQSAHAFVFELDEPFMQSIMCDSYGPLENAEDVIDMMDKVYGDDDEQDVRIDFGDLTISVEKRTLNGTTFDMSKLRNALEFV